MSTKELQIAERARKHKHEAITNLHQFIDEDWLKESYQSLNRNSKPGIDGKSWQDYESEKERRIPELLTEFKSGKYKAPAVKRTYIPKGKTEKRPLGIPTIEDKILQESVQKILNPIYEEDFMEYSYGFRKGRSAHQALRYMFEEVSFKKLHYVIDADITNYFGSIDHGILREFLDLRVKDGVIRKMIDKWLKAGILEDKQLKYSKEGTPQGGIISPILSNIYLHYVLDVWFAEQVRPRLKGKSIIIRYADDFVIGFENADDARRVMEVLPKRFSKYKLELHATKTKIVDLNKKGGSKSFDFLGFTHYLGKSKKGKTILKRKTSKKKFLNAITKIQKWIKENRHKKMKEIIKGINIRLRGHYNYYGITFNSRRINAYYEETKRILQKWLNRRGGKAIWNWNRLINLVEVWMPVLKPRIYHGYRSANPI